VRLLVVAAVVGFSCALSAGAATTTPRTTLVSAGNRGAWSNLHSYAPQVSGDGRYVAFRSSATNLVPSRRRGIFVRDRRLARTKWVSPAGIGLLAMTPSARYLLLCTMTPLIPADVPPRARESSELGRFYDAYVYDRVTGKTVRASAPVRGRNPNEWACGDTRTADLDGAISDDGRFVAFQAGASNLVPRDTNRMEDIFVRDLRARHTYRVLIPKRENKLLRGPTMSGNGRFVFFGRRLRIEGEWHEHAFMHDLRKRRTRLISTAPNGRPLSAGAYVGKSSPSGRFVLIASTSPEIAGDLENARLRTRPQFFVKDLKTGRYDLITRGIDGKGFADTMVWVSFSRNWRYLAFATEADNVVPGDTNDKLDVFWLDRAQGTTVRLNLRPDGGQTDWPFGHGGTAISADGRWVAWDSADPRFWPGEPERPTGQETQDVFIRGPMH